MCVGPSSYFLRTLPAALMAACICSSYIYALAAASSYAVRCTGMLTSMLPICSATYPALYLSCPVWPPPTSPRLPAWASFTVSGDRYFGVMWQRRNARAHAHCAPLPTRCRITPAVYAGFLCAACALLPLLPAACCLPTPRCLLVCCIRAAAHHSYCHYLPCAACAYAARFCLAYYLPIYHYALPVARTRHHPVLAAFASPYLPVRSPARTPHALAARLDPVHLPFA